MLTVVCCKSREAIFTQPHHRTKIILTHLPSSSINPQYQAMETSSHLLARLLQHPQSLLVVRDILTQLLALSLNQIEINILAASIPKHAVLHSTKLSHTVITKAAIGCDQISNKCFVVADQEPLKISNEMVVKSQSRDLSNLNPNPPLEQIPEGVIKRFNKVTDNSHKPLRGTVFQIRKFPSYNISLNMQLENSSIIEEENFHRHRKTDVRKLKHADERWMMSRKAIKITDTELDLTSIKTKHEKAFKFVYDDEGRKVYISNMERLIFPEETDAIFEYDKSRERDSTWKKSERTERSQPFRAKDRLNVGQSSYEINKVEQFSAFNRNFVQPAVPEVVEERRQKGRRDSYSLFKQTQTYLNNSKQKSGEQENLESIHKSFKFLNMGELRERSIHMSNSSIKLTTKPSKIRIFNEELMRKMNQLTEKKLPQTSPITSLKQLPCSRVKFCVKVV